MGNIATSKEYRNPKGDIELKVLFDDNKVVIEDGDRKKIEITEAQARWLGTELDNQFGGGSKSLSDNERVLFLTGGVDEDNIADLQKEFLSIAYKEYKRPKKERGYITLFINTHGGECASGFALMETIEYVRGMGIPVIGVVQGVAFSMGSVILQACSTRLIGRFSRLMLHEVSKVARGKMNELKTDVKEMHAITYLIAETFAERNTADHKDPDFWMEFIEGQDKYLSSSEACEMGLADGVYEPLVKWEMPILD